MPKIPYKKRSDGRYYKQIVIGFDENGKRKVKTLYDRNWRELDKKVRELQLSLDNDNYIAKDITLGECIDLWWKTKNDLTQGTKYGYKLRLQMFEEIFEVKLKDLKSPQIQRILDERCQTAKGAKAKAAYELLNSILKFAVRKRYANINVLTEIDKPKTKSDKRRALTKYEKNAVENSLSNLKPKHKAVLAILYYTGMRKNEVLCLKCSDINFKNNYIDVKRTLAVGVNGIIYEKNTPKTTASVRKIPMIPRLKDILIEYIDFLQGETECLFLTRNGTWITNGNFNVIWANILKKINQNTNEKEIINITPHYFRHNYATELIYAGIPLKTAQYIMGHENIDTLMNIYADVRMDAEDVISKMSTYMG